MAQETEAKFYVSQPDELKRRLEQLGGVLSEPRVLERNVRFDTPNHDLRRAARVLRLRQDSRARLTYKDTDDKQAGAFSRREVEITVSDFAVTKELLEALGYEVSFVYEKYRTTYKLDTLEIMLDELPYGHFVEIEGQGSLLKAMAEQLHLSWDAAIPESYSRLYENLRSSRSLDARDLTFDSLRGFRVSPSDLGVRAADQ